MDILTAAGSVKSQVELPESLFGRKGPDGLLWESARQRLANQRQGTAKAKTRAEVSGTGKKPWRQKHTGRARHGSKRSPIWRGGGIVFGPLPRDYSYEMPKKERAQALALALSARHAAQAVKVVEDFSLAQAKTKEMAGVLKSLGLKGRVLLVVEAAGRDLLLAGRNIPTLKIVPARLLGPYDVLVAETVLFTEKGLAALVGKAGVA